MTGEVFEARVLAFARQMAELGAAPDVAYASVSVIREAIQDLAVDLEDDAADQRVLAQIFAEIARLALAGVRHVGADRPGLVEDVATIENV
ncbi:MAG: hypothetical protein AAGD13_00740 [Pseudomonadota bacterium]